MTGPNPKPVPMFTWLPVTSTARLVSVRLSGYDGEYVLFWGDQKSEVAVGNEAVRKRTPYPADGAYMLTARDRADRDKVIAQEQVVIRSGTTAAGVSFEVDPNNAQRIVATFTEVAPEGILPRISIDWGDGSSPDVAWAIPGDTVTKILKPGTYTRMVRDLGTKRWLRESYTVHEDHSDPDGTFTQAKADDPMTVRFTVTSVSSAKTIDIDWGAGEVTSLKNPKVGSTIDYTYPFADEFLPWVSFSDGTGRAFGGYVKVPFTDEEHH